MSSSEASWVWSRKNTGGSKKAKVEKALKKMHIIHIHVERWRDVPICGASWSNPNTHRAPVWQLANIRANSTDTLTLICASVHREDGSRRHLPQVSSDNIAEVNKGHFFRVHLLHCICMHMDLLPLDLGIYTCLLEHNLHLECFLAVEKARACALCPSVHCYQTVGT